MKTETVWQCKIGLLYHRTSRRGSDAPMREAIRRAFQEVVGVEPQFIFSGWGAKLSEAERKIVQDRT